MANGQSIGYDSGTIFHFKTILLARKVSLLAMKQRNGDPISVEDFRSASWQDRARSLMAEQHHKVEVAVLERGISDVENALTRIEENTYGICTACGEPIILARLEAFPTASRCVPCQANHHS